MTKVYEGEIRQCLRAMTDGRCTLPNCACPVAASSKAAPVPQESPLGWIVFVHCDPQGYDYRIFADELQAHDVAGENPENGEPVPLYRASAFGVSAIESLAWQPLETAPKDGTHVLMYRADGFSEAWWKKEPGLMGVYWGGKGWWYPSHSLPTHWMPLPSAPTDGGTAT